MKLLIKISLVFFLLAATACSQAQSVEHIVVYSSKMQKEVNNIVILPSGYNDFIEYPVLYLLHGYGGDHTTWIKIKPGLKDKATQYNIIIVCPDAENSWYWDSPVLSGSQYETYVSSELVGFIDKKYRTIKTPDGRGITGFSMGGHGALWLAINHQDVFGACGSMAGGVDIRPFSNNWEMSKSLGSYTNNKSIWDKHTVMNIIPKIMPGRPAIAIDCGMKDFFFDVNKKLHEKLSEKSIPHVYTVRPGEHNNEYCTNAVDYQILFFHKFFTKK